jgi:glucose/arabinose dehydrogenase/cytochrome c553
MHRLKLFLTITSLLLLLTSLTRAQPDKHSAAHLLHVPPGFEATVYSEGQNFALPTQLTFGPDGHLYVLSLTGSVFRLIDADGDHFAEEVQTAFWDGDRNYITPDNVEQVSGLPDQLFHAAGMAFRDDVLYISDSGRINTLEDRDDDGYYETLTTLVEGLVSLRYEGHSNNGIAFGPDDKLYVSVGATTDHGPLQEPQEARVLRMNPDGSDLEVFATGLRNAFDLTFAPNGDLFTADNNPTEVNRSLRFIPPEELNHLQAGQDYGFPEVYGQPPPGHPSVGPVTEFYPSVVTAGLTYYADTAFPDFWSDGVYVAQWGTTADVLVNRDLLFGFAVVYVPLTQDANGQYHGDFVEFAQSATGSPADFRPIDVTVGPDGALYIIDFFSSRIFRVTYTGFIPEPTAVTAAAAEPIPNFPPDVLTFGQTLFNNGARNAPACVACHKAEGDANGLGPSLQDLRAVAGSRIPNVSAAEYIRQSILQPQAYEVEGFNAGYMPQNYGEALTDEEIDALVAYVLTLTAGG